MRRIMLICLWFMPLASLMAQEEEKPRKFIVKGYLKDMPSINYLGDSSLFQNLIHNRINMAWYANKRLTIVGQFRNRLLTGDFVKEIPNYGSIIDSNNDYFDLSTNLIDNKDAVLNVMADRLYARWSNDTWEITAGRQRINWGVTVAWNPNDWFNAYSFFDFDYEERPGADAIRIVHYTGVASSVEVAAKMAKDAAHFASAGMWKVNKWDYDMQFQAGFAQGDLALGTGWAGNLGLAGFKGELTYFHKAVDTYVNAAYTDMFLGAISVDYSFSNSLYLNGSVMYNSQGSSHPAFGFTNFIVRPGTVRSLSPYKWSSFLQTSYPFTPLLTGGLALIGYPGSDTFFINPTLTISLKQNLDLDLIGQLYYGNNQNGNITSLLKAGYARLKWSF